MKSCIRNAFEILMFGCKEETMIWFLIVTE